MSFSVNPVTGMPLHPTNSSARILHQLYFLRNITITFILLMAVVALLGLNINLPVLPLTIILLIMAVTNLVTRFFIDSGKEITDRIIFTQLLLEIFSFSLILYFTGGATNPFTFFFLIPLAISATVIPGRRTWLLTLLTVILYSLLLKYYVPLTYQLHDHQHPLSNEGQFSQHVLGMWFGFLVSAMLVTWFITFLSRELKRRDQAIAEARRRELRDQQMVTLGTLAAGTAHELGTPLASLAIVTADLTDGYNPEQHAELFENQRILREQINRCKQILSVLSDSAGESRADEGFLLSADQFLERIIAQWRAQRSDIPCEFTPADPPFPGHLLFDKTISQALLNLLNNAADETQDRIELRASARNKILQLRIIDHGPGMTDEQISMAGETTFSNKPHGMGIGLFLAITTIRRIGGSVQFQRLDDSGTCTLVELPLIESAHE